ncbi:kinase-like protein [Dentipellis sp. KUC8613]|nr:kinase-like protein [Dentipellis sp. KUC8613]
MHTRRTTDWPGWPDDGPEEDEKVNPWVVRRANYLAILWTPERQWAKIQPWLQSQGYMLRPRFRPGWTPSWKSKATGKEMGFREAEDAIAHDSINASTTIDAIRTSDGRHVCLKRVTCQAEDSTELSILQFLSQAEYRNDPRNHAIPVLDVIRAPDHCFLVLPFFRTLMSHEEPFNTIGEGFDLVSQTLEGLAWLHELRIAHRDISPANILMDAGRMFPHGYHFDSVTRDKRGRSLSSVRTRTQVGGVRYYLIDFGESIKFEPFDSVLIDVWSRASIHAPETVGEDRPPYDPFKADVYSTGETLRKMLVNEYEGYFDMLLPLIDSMTTTDPNARPTVKEALEEFGKIKASYSRTAQHARIRPPYSDPENTSERAFFGGWHWTKQFLFAVRNFKWYFFPEAKSPSYNFDCFVSTKLAIPPNTTFTFLTVSIALVVRSIRSPSVSPRRCGYKDLIMDEPFPFDRHRHTIPRTRHRGRSIKAIFLPRIAIGNGWRKPVSGQLATAFDTGSHPAADASTPCRVAVSHQDTQIRVLDRVKDHSQYVLPGCSMVIDVSLLL